MLARHAQHTALIMPSANCSCEESAETFSSDAARDRLLDDGRLLGRSVHTTAMTNTRARTRCQGLGAGSGQHLLRAAHASSRAKTAALEALVEVGGRGGSGSAVSVVAERAPRALERLWEFACPRRSGFPANAHWSGAGRRRVRQREKSHLHPARARGAECNPGQARKENLAHPRSACPDAAGVPATPLSPPCSDRESVQFGEAQALGSRARSFAAHPDPSSPAARLEFQSVSSEASLPFLEDVNRARWLLATNDCSPFAAQRWLQLDASGYSDARAVAVL